MSRDLALICLVALIVVVAMVCATVIVVAAHAPAAAGLGVVTACVGVGSFALGRLTGQPTTAAA